MKKGRHDARWDAKVLHSKNPAEQPSSIREALKKASNRAYDEALLLDSDYGMRILDRMQPLFLSSDPSDEKVIAFWRERGLRKECMIGGPEPWNHWEIFTPLSALEPENSCKKYPLVIALHGGSAGEFDGASLFFTECNYAYKAAEEEFILALLDKHDVEGIMALYNHLVENYPVDTSRVYLAGYSAGSDRSTNCGLHHPELFAGLLIGAGLPFTFVHDEELKANAKKYKLPVICVGCLGDKGNHTPFYNTNPVDNPMPEFIAKLFYGENKMRWINSFFDINHIPYYSLEENKEYLAHSGTPEEKRIGLRAQESWTYEEGGIHHMCLGYRDAEGMQSVRYIFIEDMPHFEPPNLMDIGWDFLKRFSRDPETHALICSGDL